MCIWNEENEEKNDWICSSCSSPPTNRMDMDTNFEMNNLTDPVCVQILLVFGMFIIVGLKDGKSDLHGMCVRALT